MKLKQALKQLDPKNDAHWTAAGAPRIDAVTEIMGEDVDRTDINDVAPTLTRSTAPEPEKEQAGGDDNANPNSPDSTADTSAPDSSDESSEPDADESNAADEKQAARQAVNDAREALNEARANFNEAQAALDAIVRREERERKQVSQAARIQQFQRSQQAQRRKAAEEQRNLAKFAKKAASE